MVDLADRHQEDRLRKITTTILGTAPGLDLMLTGGMSREGGRRIAFEKNSGRGKRMKGHRDEMRRIEEEDRIRSEERQHGEERRRLADERRKEALRISERLARERALLEKHRREEEEENRNRDRWAHVTTQKFVIHFLLIKVPNFGPR
jgi:hypothetical protein